MKRHALINYFYAYALMHTLVKEKKNVDSDIYELITEYLLTHNAETPNLNLNHDDLTRLVHLCLGKYIRDGHVSFSNSSGMVCPYNVVINITYINGEVGQMVNNVEQQTIKS